jgi:EAL domain-containing protein (putative c-di-GMP-specific phosphodiesterase class I)
MVLLTQKEMFDAVSAKFPDLLTKPVHRPMRLTSPLHTMQLQEKTDLFRSALQGMLAEISNGKNAMEVAYDHERSRLWSFGLQPMWEVSSDKQQSKLLGTESLVALHGSSWAVGLILDVLDHLLNAEVEVYLQFKFLEIQAAVTALEVHPTFPSISVNLRPSEWMMPEVQRAVLEATRRAPGRLMFELTEYTQDDHFVRLFGTEGSLARRLTSTLLPVLRRLREEGVTLLADDLLPGCVYRYEGEAARREGRRLGDCYATECGLMLSDEWADVFHGVKIGLEWVVHSMAITKSSGADYAAVPLYARNVKDNPAYVAAVTDGGVPEEEADRLLALQGLQEAAAAALRVTLGELKRRPLSLMPVFEGTVPPGAAAAWALEGSAKEQGGMFFEARFPPAWFYGRIPDAPLAQAPAESPRKKRLPT